MKFPMTGQERVTFKYRWLLNRGDLMGRFDCIYLCCAYWNGFIRKFILVPDTVTKIPNITENETTSGHLSMGYIVW